MPDDIVRRRFHSGWRNFLQTYRLIVDEWDNQGPAGSYVVTKDEDPYNEQKLWHTHDGRPDPGIESAMRRATIKARRRAIALTGRVVTIRDGKLEYDTEP